MLTLAGFWAGRYGETTGRDRRVAPLVAVGVITVLAGLFACVLHYMLGDEVDARHALLTALAPTLLANLVLALPVYALVRRAVGEELWVSPRPRWKSLSSEGGAYHEPRSKSGRFLPPDPRVREPYRLMLQLALRVGIFGAVALIAFVVLFLRLWSLQVLSGDEYLNAAQNNQLRLIRIEAPRGPILDRYGRTVVSNVAGTAVQLWVADMPKRGRYELVQRLAQGPRRLPSSPGARGRGAPGATRSLRSPSRRRSARLRSTTCTSTGRSSRACVIVQTYLRDYSYGRARRPDTRLCR